MTKKVATTKHFLGALGPIRYTEAGDHWEMRSGDDLLGTWRLRPQFQADFTPEALAKINKWLGLWGGILIPAHGDLPAYVAKADLQHLLVALTYA